ncbi:hypothetical protein D9M73_105430 [compost metagenome]
MRQGVAAGQPGAVDGIQRGHASDQRVGIAVDGQAGIAAAQGDGCLDAVVRAVIEHKARVGARCGDGRVEGDVVAGRQGQHTVGAPVDAVVDINVSCGSAGALGIEDGDRAVVAQLRGERRSRHVAAAGRNREVGRVYQPGAALPAQALGCLGRNQHVIGHLDAGRTGFNETAITTIWRRCIQRTANIDGAVFHVPHEQDAASLVLEGLRFNDARVVDRCCGQAVHGFC